MAKDLQIVAGNAQQLLQLVTFHVGGEGFAVEVASVREIMRLPVITTLPNAPAYVDGIINLRGGVIPIISLRERFGLCAAENDSHTRIMVMTVGEKVVGFRVDAVSEVIRVPQGQLQPPPQLVASGGGRQCVTGVIDHGERLLIVVDPEQLLLLSELDWEAHAA